MVNLLYYYNLLFRVLLGRYTSQEKNQSQIKLRADRIGVKNKEMLHLNETFIENVLSYLSIKENHHQLIIDPIQTLYSNQIASPIGSISQIRECCSQLLQLRKKEPNITIFIIGLYNDGQIVDQKF